MLQRDYLMRMIARAIAALARALGLQKKGQLEPALDQLGEAYDAVLKFDRAMLDSLDPATLVSMLGDEPIVRIVARISKTEGELLEERGNPAQALACFRRALELYAAVGAGDDPADRLAADQLAARFRPRH